MTKHSHWYWAAILGALLIQAAWTVPSVQAETRLSTGAEPRMAVAIGSEDGRRRMVEATAEPKLELLLLLARQRHHACTAGVQDLMEQAYNLIFQNSGAELPHDLDIPLSDGGE